MTGLLVTALILAVQAWSNYALAGRIARLTSTDHTLFDALVTVRAQIPKNSTALIALDDPRPVIGATQEEALRTVRAATAALSATEVPNHAQYVAAIDDAWRKVEALQGSVATQAALPTSARNLLAIDAWRRAVHGLTDALNTASVVVGNEVRFGNPMIAEMVQIRRSAWTIRDRYGLQCSMLRPNVERSLPLDAAQLDAWHGNRAIYTAAWQTLDEFLLRPGVSGVMRARIDAARRQTGAAQARVDALVARFDGSDRPVLAGAAWTALCDGPFESILAIAQQAQVEALQHAEAIRAGSFRVLLLAGAELMAVVGFGIFAVIHVQRRLTRPMKILSGSIARLSRREFEQAVPATGNPDELGSMAQALEALRTSALEAERLQLAMSRFTADASHQMRTPLTILRTHIAVLAELMPGNDAGASSLKDIRDAADRLQRLLIQLLKLARADGAQAGEESGTIDLREIVHEAASKHLPQAVEAGVELHFEAPSRPFPIRANAIMINELLANLIDNAIGYNQPGGSVIVRLSDEAGTHTIDVEDDGPGIPELERDKVFTRFYRLNRDQDRVGSGLGLAIVGSLATTLNARISMRTPANQRGLCVRVSFG
ncbi:MAG TPA: HAMP domain-containing sensor histidine kinase [Steroidobacteraceae bacterium]